MTLAVDGVTTENIKKTQNCIIRDLFFLSQEMCNGKAILVQAWTGPEGSRSLSLPDFRTLATCSRSDCQPYTPAASTTPGNNPSTIT
jgi:hypothetical protein